MVSRIRNRILMLGLLGAALARADLQAAEDLAASVDRRVEAWQPTAEERRVDLIGRAADIRTALRLGKEHQRPIFLFTHDGRLGVGRQ